MESEHRERTEANQQRSQENQGSTTWGVENRGTEVPSPGPSLTVGKVGCKAIRIEVVTPAVLEPQKLGYPS